MKTKFYIYLVIILGLNSFRYITYLLEDSNVPYNIIMLCLNVLGLIFCVFSFTNNRNLHSGS